MPVEQILSRELREVADNVPVPALPPLPQEPPRTGRHWGPLLVAAAAVLIVAGAIAVAASYRDDAGPAPSPDRIDPPTIRPLTTDAPPVPYVFDDRLYIDGDQLPGRWTGVSHAGGAWVAQSLDFATVQWGTDSDAHTVPGRAISEPHLSPDGTLLAVSTTDDGGRMLLIDTGSGDTVETLAFDAIGASAADQPGVIAVTDDAQVFLDTSAGQLLWPAGEGDDTVDLSETAPGQWIEDATPAGLIVLDERDLPYLADASDAGELSRLGPIPGSGAVVNPSGTWLAYGGSGGGESQTIPYITARSVDGGRSLELRPPPGAQQLLALAWEDDDLLLAEVYDGAKVTGLARCSIREERCVVIKLP